MEVTREHIRGALTYISADLPRDEWVRIGMAIKSEFPTDDGLAMFDEWSAKGQGYKPKEIAAQWRSFKTNGGVTIGTLLKEAKDNGFVTDGGVYTTSAATVSKAVLTSDEQAAEERAKAMQQAETAVRAKDLWDKNPDAVVGEPVGYLLRKGVEGYGVRVTQDGTVLVPMRDEKDALWNVQFIAAVKPEDGSSDKRFLSGGRKAGLWHMMGDAQDGKDILVAEGYATAASLHEATGLPVAVAFDAGNLRKVAQGLRTRYPTARLVICGDNDLATLAKTGKNPGVEKAQQAALAVNGLTVFPEQLPAGGSDFNDLQVHLGKAQGLVAIRHLIEQAINPSIAQAAVKPEAAEQDKAVPFVNTMSEGLQPEITVDSNAVGQGAPAANMSQAGAQPLPAASNPEGTAPISGNPDTPLLQKLRLAYEKLDDQYKRAEGKFYFRDDDKTVAFEDRRSSLFTLHSKPDVIRSMVELAKAKDWKTLHLKGSDDFMREAWLEGSLAGMKVTGYEPLPIDLVRLKERVELQALDKTLPANVNIMSSDPILRPDVAAERRTPEQQAEQQAQAREQLQKETAVMRDLTQVLAKTGATPEQTHITLDAVKSLLVTDRAYVGKVLAFGDAPYKHLPLKQGEKNNYFVRVEKPNGAVEDIWGVDLRRAMPLGNIKVGDDVFIAYQGEKAVAVEAPEFDKDGKFLKMGEKITHRNEWMAERVSSLRDDAQQGVVHKAELPKSTMSTEQASSTPYTDSTAAIGVLHAAMSMKGVPSDVIHASLTSARDAISSNPLQGGVSIKLVNSNGVDHVSAPIAAPITTPAPTATPSSPAPNIGM